MNKIREARQSLGLTQRQLADKIGVDQPTISRIENGARPDLDVAPKLADALNVGILEILYPEREAA